MKYLNWLILLSITINGYSNELFLKDSIYNNIEVDSIEKQNKYPDFLTREYYNLDKRNIVSKIEFPSSFKGNSILAGLQKMSSP